MMIVILILLCALAIVIFIQYKKTVKRANDRFAGYQAKSQTIETSFGKLTYIDEGEGEVILSCHGICGGYDQAYDTLADHTDEYRVLAPSRFGYPGSDMPEHATIHDQCTAFAELLDQLHIDKVYILGTSAGGSSAIRFALDYPERTKGLILYCSGYPALKAPEKKLSYAGPPAPLCHDFPMWFFSPLFGPIMGMNRDTIEIIMPLEERHQGIVFDASVTNTDMDNNYTQYDLAKLTVPVLIFHAKDDKLADYNRAAQWAERIPDCTYHFFESGGHLMEGNSATINTMLKEFTTR